MVPLCLDQETGQPQKRGQMLISILKAPWDEQNNENISQILYP